MGTFLSMKTTIVFGNEQNSKVGGSSLLLQSIDGASSNFMQVEAEKMDIDGDAQNYILLTPKNIKPDRLNPLF